ncbi:MAG: leucine--tRNA ligase, partial [Candidatus Methanoperedens sp.]|nr:leucine--tRNA ligase [Candidatus Methanoperedens sp.]
ELAEEITGNTLKDIEEIIRLIRIKPKRVILYTAASWKKKVLVKAIMMKKDNVLDMKTLMSALMSDPLMRPFAKEIPKFAQKIITDVQGMEKELMSSLTEVDFDETKALYEAVDFLNCEIGCSIEIYSADAPEYDPQGKSKNAVPMRPAIYIE